MKALQTKVVCKAKIAQHRCKCGQLFWTYAKGGFSACADCLNLDSRSYRPTAPLPVPDRAQRQYHG